jgi:hypothetical protein
VTLTVAFPFYTRGRNAEALSWGSGVGSSSDEEDSRFLLPSLRLGVGMTKGVRCSSVGMTKG